MLFDELKELFSAGEVLLSFSDTVPGLFCSPFSLPAINKISWLKRRDLSKGYLVLKHDVSNICNVGPLHQRFIERFWPGPLTIVFTLKDKRLFNVSPDNHTIAVRRPCNIFWTPFLQHSKMPVLSTSSNEHTSTYFNALSSFLASTSSLNILSSCQINDRTFYLLSHPSPISYILLDAHSTPDVPSLPSTVIRLENNVLEVLREGAVSSAELKLFFEDISGRC